MLQKRQIRLLNFLAAAWVACAPPAFAAAIKLEPEEMEFFEKKVRPVLSERCYKCHSTQPGAKIKGDLALDSREATRKGGQTGPAVVPGKPEKSLLLKAIKHLDADLQMPPDEEKMPDNLIANLEQWIRMGAPDPREATDRKVGAVDFEKAKNHWAFKPVANPAPPKVANKGGFIQSPIDAFVLAKLNEKGLAPSPKTDKRSLIRRVSYDLTGLPPTADEVEAFVKDSSKDAYVKLVDRLLASPRFGEHWGRLWLDVARYADTTGDRQNGGRSNPLYPYAWTYRDYVIESFNKDLPYDQFVLQQIAADRLPESKDDHATLRALGFLTVGKTFMGNENEMIDDRIDVVTKGLMAFTVSCARCHDHKFDPITSKDYYGLHGVFASSRAPSELPMVCQPAPTPEYTEFQKKIAEVENQVKEYHQTEMSRVRAGLLDRAGEYLLAVRDANLSGAIKSGNVRNVARKFGLDAAVFELWLDTLKANRKSPHPVLVPWFAFLELPDKDFARQAKTVAANLGKTKPANQYLVEEFQQKPPASMKEVAAVYTRVLGQLQKAVGAKPFAIETAGRANNGLQVGVKPLADARLEELRGAFFAERGCVELGEREMQRLLGVQFRNRESAIRSQEYALEMSHPGSPARAMTLEDINRPRDSRVMIRGEARNLGEVAPRRFIQVLAQDPKPFKDGSGRLELARSIASRENPLTARVWVNRVWKNLFGEAIVRTPSDFGTRSEPPTHPEMLDWLASYLMDHQWSSKQLIRAIVLSSTYQQDSKANAKGMLIDPVNQYLWRMNLRRLSFEEIRDSFLTAGGNLDLRVGGQPIKLDPADDARAAGRKQYNFNVALKADPRRTVYGMVDRGALPEMLRTFDFANPDMTSGERILTTVPQQALFMMNSPFVVDEVRHLLARADFQAQKTPEDKVTFLYRAAYQRPPTSKELKMSLDFLFQQPDNELGQLPIKADPESENLTAAKVAAPDTKSRSKSSRTSSKAQRTAITAKPLDAWERYTQVLLIANEFVFLN